MVNENETFMNTVSGNKDNENSIPCEEALTLFRNLHVAHMMISRAREQELKKRGVSYEEVQTLNAIESIGGKPTITDITYVSVKSYHTIAAIVKRIEGKGLLIKELDPDTKGLWRLIITEKGQKVMDFARNTDSLTSIFSTFTKDERNQIDSLINRACKSAILYSALNNARGF